MEEKIKSPAYKKILNEREDIQLICHKCGKEWIEQRPKGYVVRYTRGTNFLINRCNPEEKKFFKCPDCHSRKIGRLAVKKIRKTMPSPMAGPSHEKEII